MTMTSNFTWFLQMQAQVLTPAWCGALKAMPPPHKFLAFEYLVSTIQKCGLVGGSMPWVPWGHGGFKGPLTFLVSSPCFWFVV